MESNIKERIFNGGDIVKFRNRYAPLKMINGRLVKQDCIGLVTRIGTHLTLDGSVKSHGCEIAWFQTDNLTMENEYKLKFCKGYHDIKRCFICENGFECAIRKHNLPFGIKQLKAKTSVQDEAKLNLDKRPIE